MNCLKKAYVRVAKDEAVKSKTSNGIIKSFNILKNKLIGVIIITDFKPMNPFTLQKSVKRLQACVVIGRCFATVISVHQTAFGELG